LTAPVRYVSFVAGEDRLVLRKNDMDDVTKDEALMQIVDRLGRIDGSTQVMARELRNLRGVVLGENAEERRQRILLEEMLEPSDA